MVMASFGKCFWFRTVIDVKIVKMFFLFFEKVKK